jgi:hypothetical protein
LSSQATANLSSPSQFVFAGYGKFIFSFASYGEAIQATEKPSNFYPLRFDKKQILTFLAEASPKPKMNFSKRSAEKCIRRLRQICFFLRRLWRSHLNVIPKTSYLPPAMPPPKM